MKYTLNSNIEDLNDMYDLIRNKVRKITDNFDMYYNAARFGINNNRRRMSELNYDEMIKSYNIIDTIDNTDGLESKMNEIGSKLDGQLELWN